jgi:hypothetical protein
MSKRLPWNHQSRYCVYCGRVGPRTYVLGGWAHKRCIPSRKLEKRKKAEKTT